MLSLEMEWKQVSENVQDPFFAISLLIYSVATSPKASACYRWRERKKNFPIIKDATNNFHLFLVMRSLGYLKKNSLHLNVVYLLWFHTTVWKTLKMIEHVTFNFSIFFTAPSYLWLNLITYLNKVRDETFSTRSTSKNQYSNDLISVCRFFEVC